jgi:dUTP pyrophosphatase
MTKKLIMKVMKLPHGEGVPVPKYMSHAAAGMDIYAAVDKEIILKPGERKLIPTGFKMSIPEGVEAQIRPRSGLALKNGISVLNTPGTIDADYRGEVGVILINLGQEDFKINRGDRIAQMIINKVEQADIEEVKTLDETNRSSGGFGHTGV